MFRLFKRNREAIKKYLLIFFLGVVSFGMVITLAPIPTGDTDRRPLDTLAEYNGHRISVQDLLRTIQSRFRGAQLNYDSRLVPVMAGAVLDDIILRQALEAQAKKLGIEVSDEELLKAVQGIPWLSPSGTFIGMDRYQDLIQQQTGMTVSQFESQLRESLLLDKMRAVVTDGLRVSPAEVREEFLRRNAKAKIEYVLFEPSQFMRAVEVTPQALEAFFKKDPQRYKVPEQRQAQYVLIDADSVRAQVRVGEEELRQYYTQHLSDYRVPDRVKVAHILFKTTGKNTGEIATIEKTAQDILAQVKSGSDFGDLARRNSEDSTASNGGEVGWIVRGQTVKEFEEAAFSMKPGQVSDLIKTIYGIHIVKVLDRQLAHLQTFEEVRENIRTTVEKRKVEAVQQAVAAELQRELNANPREFESVARKKGFEPRNTALFRFGQTLPDFGSSEAFANLAFQLRPLEIGTPITVPKGLALIQVIEVVPEHLPKLEEVQARVEEDFRADQSKVLATEKAQDFAAKSRTGDFKKLAQASKYTAKETKDFAQQDYVEGLGSGAQFAAAFSLMPGQTSDAMPLGGNNIVFRIVSRTPANESELAGQQDRITEELLERKRSLSFEIYRQNLKQQLIRSGELRVYDDAMKQFLASYQKG